MNDFDKVQAIYPRELAVDLTLSLEIEVLCKAASYVEKRLRRARDAEMPRDLFRHWVGFKVRHGS